MLQRYGAPILDTGNLCHPIQYHSRPPWPFCIAPVYLVASPAVFSHSHLPYGSLCRCTNLLGPRYYFSGGPVSTWNSSTVQEEAEWENKEDKKAAWCPSQIIGRGLEEYSTFFFLYVPHQNVQLLAACEWSGMFITDESTQLNRFFSTVSPYTQSHTSWMSHSSASHPVSSTTKGLLPPTTIISHTIIQCMHLLLPDIYTLYDQCMWTPQH